VASPRRPKHVVSLLAGLEIAVIKFHILDSGNSERKVRLEMFLWEWGTKPIHRQRLRPVRRETMKTYYIVLHNTLVYPMIPLRLDK
jgi:hypothetical protein